MLSLVLALILTPGESPPHARLDRHERPAPVELVITPETVVELDGKPCKIGDVPAAAEVILLDVAADGKTVKKIGFRRKK